MVFDRQEYGLGRQVDVGEVGWRSIAVGEAWC